jgi:nucleotide-binding universal stress UspA family protein
MKVHRILAPTDFSEPAQRALGYAAELAKLYGASLTLVYVDPPPIYVPDAIGYIPPGNAVEIVAAFEKDLTKLQGEARALGAGEVTTKYIRGVPWFEIVELAAANRYDLIVMGTHGRSGLSHVLLGSVAEKVVRKAPCPVLTVGPARD